MAVCVIREPVLKLNLRANVLFAGIGPKVTQSVLTAAFLFAFKDVLYDVTVQARRRLAAKKA